MTHKTGVYKNAQYIVHHVRTIYCAVSTILPTKHNYFLNGEAIILQILVIPSLTTSKKESERYMRSGEM